MLVDNLKHVKIMKEAGFDEPQSRAVVEVWSSIVELNLATKDDILLVRKDMELFRKDMEIIFLKERTITDDRFNRIDSRLDRLESSLFNLESTLFAKFAAMQLVSLGLMTAIIKYL